jgi:DNA modification methylase
MSDIVWTPVRVRLGQIRPWDKNPRMSSKRQAERLIKSERDLGQIQTLAIGPADDDGLYPLYDGHQRCKAWFTVKGAEFELWAMQSNRPLREEERRQAAILVHTATGGWDWNDVTGWDAGELKEWGFDEDTLKGWQEDSKNLKEFLQSEKPSADAEPQTDRAAELLEKWGVKPGDLWQIGDHRLVCGDCTDAAVVEKISGEEIGAVIADPPYGVDAVANSPRLQELGYTQFEGDKDTDIARSAFGVYSPISDVQVWFGANYYTECLPVSSGWIIWDKDHHGMDFADAELAWTNVDCPIRVFRHAWSGADRDSEKGEKRLHPTQKPAALAQWIIEKYVGNDGVVVDPFAGAGWVLVACENLSRRCRAIEISPAYVAVALQRMADAFPALPIKRLE